MSKKRAIFERTITCDCGNLMDRDLNSAINIMVKFLDSKHKYDFLSQEPSLDEESFLLTHEWNGFLRQTGLLDLEAEAYS